VHSSRDLALRPDFAARAVDCVDDHRDWSAAEHCTEYRLVLVRRGRFRRRSKGLAADVDPTVGYFSVPGDEEHFAHPAGGDVCTALSLSPKLWRLLFGDTRLTTPTVYVDGALDLAHRRFLAAARTADVDYAMAEGLLVLFRTAAGQAADLPASGRRGDRTIVDQARAAIVANHPASTGLFPLADLLGVSPYRLSRAFPRQLGVSLTRYRNRVRVGRALDRLEAGEPSLALLAADLGFADQAHLTRTLREHTTHPPTTLRRLLA
jgi:AraC-like DNA-binding protein